MGKTRAGYSEKSLRHLHICLALEFDRADKVAHEPAGEPGLDQPQQPRGVADNIAEEPIDGSDRRGVERKRTYLAVIEVRQCCDRRIERRLVDADHPAPEFLQRPAPAAGRAAQIEAEIAGTGPSSRDGQRFPQFEISAVGWTTLVF